MGWVESQIEERRKYDDEQLAESLQGLSDAITGRHQQTFKDDLSRAEHALSEVLAYYGTKPGKSVEAFDDLQDLIDWTMKSTGIMNRPVSLTGAWYKDAAGAMLGFMEDGTPIALLPRVHGGYAYRDPSTGKRKFVTASTARLMQQDAWCFYRPLPQHELDLGDLFMFMFKSLDLGDYVAIFAASLVAVLLGMLIPVVNQIIFGPIIAYANSNIIIPIAALLVSVTFSQLILDGLKNLIMSHITIQQKLPLEAALMMRVLNFPASFFKKHSTGELTSRINAVQEVATVLQDAVFSTIPTAVFSLVYIAEIASITPALALPAFLIILSSILFVSITMIVKIRVARKVLGIETKLSGWQLGLINGMQKLKVTGSEKRAFATWAEIYKDSARLTYAPPLILRLDRPIQTAITLAGTIVLYILAIQGGVDVASYMAFVTAYGMVSAAFMAMSSAATRFVVVKPYLELAEPILKEVPETSEKRPTVNRVSGAFSFDKVRFSYGDGMPNVFDNLTFKVRSGEYVGIVGTTGCGKSTIIRLLLGFEKPDRGAVYYDKNDLLKVDAASVRRHIGVVLQDGKLFQGTIFDNIAISAPQLTMDEAWEVAELAGIADDIRNMPMGMQTFISEGQGGVSGGQHQRLMIARAIASNPKILMFDEATSALDNVSQKHVTESLSTLKCTRVVIAHRLSTVQHCDRILVIDGGKVAEEGTYEELIQKGGLFTELFERQQL